ncbi:MAG TPA: aconitate hydratase AcnA, partial [Acidimicrobiales bacterium]|nr:aconitate hydratase AcnA [Acidimicrobiales bacterium]
GQSVSPEEIEGLCRWNGTPQGGEIAFSPARVLMQDFTGVPAVADLAAMRDAMIAWGSDPEKINPLVPAELVIDHSVVVDSFGTEESFSLNVSNEFTRNSERYRFLRWGQSAFKNFAVVPPGTGICHQVNLEYLARVVFVDAQGNAFPDTLVGTDSHTTMVNGIGVVGWGVGGIEAEAAMLGQPISMLIPKVVGLELQGALPEGATATDLVLTIAELLRSHGVVGKFVEVFGSGVANVSAENRATIGNMSPEYGSTVTIFPIDSETLRYLRMTGRPEAQIALVEAYAKEQGMWHEPESSSEAGSLPLFSERLLLDLAQVVPSIAGPSRPQDRVPLARARQMFGESLSKAKGIAASSKVSHSPISSTSDQAVQSENEGLIAMVEVSAESGDTFGIGDGSVVIAAITSCTNTSNPSVMIAAGLLAQKAVNAGLMVKPWVKTSLAPGSKVVMDYYERSGLTCSLEKLRFNLVGFGCTTCIGNSGPLDKSISAAISEHELNVAAVLSGNRNFEGRINPDVRMNYLASPPLVIAYALAGTMNIDFYSDPIGVGTGGRDIYLKDIWPSQLEISQVVADSIDPAMFRKSYGEVFAGDERWNALEIPTGELYEWDSSSTYVRRPPFFEGLSVDPSPLVDLEEARILAVLGNSVTTDHISPAGSIKVGSPAGQWLEESGVPIIEFNSYGSRRGNHEVMIRGTLANTRIRNAMVPGIEGGYTTYMSGSDGTPQQRLETGEVLPIYDAAMAYAARSIPLVIVAGKEYGSGSSRDWAAKGVALLGVRCVIAESYERIHRSNLIGMGILPLQFVEGTSAQSFGITGGEVLNITGMAGWDPSADLQDRISVTVDGNAIPVQVRIDTPKEAEYYFNGGILQYVLRSLRE